MMKNNNYNGEEEDKEFLFGKSAKSENYLFHPAIIAWSLALGSLFANDYFHELIDTKKWWNAFEEIIITWFEMFFWWAVMYAILDTIFFKSSWFKKTGKYGKYVIAPIQLAVFAFVYWILFSYILK